ncbi:hypothetical protein ACFV27_00730 [Streptomyces antimycoticus]|uniref:hypothetical protein n=1 Tax=Streptomyces antimycoticus TaxID=68175 RepID=UPI0036C57A8A
MKSLGHLIASALPGPGGAAVRRQNREQREATARTTAAEASKRRARRSKERLAREGHNAPWRW